MIKVYLDVEGMRCSMCEAHVNDIVRKTSKVKKVKASHKKKEVLIIMEDDKDINNIISAINSLGYNSKLNRIENK
jgi:copper chaperone CopZ